MFLFQSFQEGPTEMKGDTESGMFFQSLQKGGIAFLPAFPENLVEIADRLMVVDGEKEMDRFHLCVLTSIGHSREIVSSPENPG